MRMGKKAVCEGEVVFKDGNNTAIKFYTEEFVLDDSIPDLERARSLIQAGLIADRLRRTIEGYKRVRTCEVVSFGSTNEQAENGKLDKLLSEAATMGCLPENIEIYADPENKARALERAIEGQKKRAKKAKADNVQDMGYVD